MNFNTEKPIYLQIVDVISDRILSGELKGGDRIPSVREYGADIGVNPNTMMRSYEKLTADGIIYNKRGIGYFVSDDARDTVLRAPRPAQGLHREGSPGHQAAHAASRTRFIHLQRQLIP